MKTKLFVFATILVVATLFAPAVFAAELSYYPKPIYFVTLSNRFPVTNEFVPIGFVCMIQSNTAPRSGSKNCQVNCKRC